VNIKYLQLRLYCLYCNACCVDEERLKNVTYLFLKFRMVKIDPLDVISHFMVYKMLNEDLLYISETVNTMPILSI
jgi:hypothetical protein